MPNYFDIVERRSVTAVGETGDSDVITRAQCQPTDVMANRRIGARFAARKLPVCLPVVDNLIIHRDFELRDARIYIEVLDVEFVPCRVARERHLCRTR